MQTFRFKPAVLRKQQTWVLDGNRLVCEGGPEIDLAKIEGGRLTDMMARRIVTSAFKLNVNGRNVTIVCNDTRAGANRIQYLNLCLAMVARLAEIKPELELDYGPPPITGYIMAAMMVGMSIFAVVMGGYVLSDLRGDYKAVIIGMFGLMAVAGLVFAYIWMPKKSDKPLTPAGMINAIRVSVGAPPTAPRPVATAARAADRDG